MKYLDGGKAGDCLAPFQIADLGDGYITLINTKTLKTIRAARLNTPFNLKDLRSVRNRLNSGYALDRMGL